MKSRREMRREKGLEQVAYWLQERIKSESAGDGPIYIDTPDSFNTS